MEGIGEGRTTRSLTYLMGMNEQLNSGGEHIDLRRRQTQADHTIFHGSVSAHKEEAARLARAGAGRM